MHPFFGGRGVRESQRLRIRILSNLQSLASFSRGWLRRRRVGFEGPGMVEPGPEFFPELGDEERQRVRLEITQLAKKTQ